MERENPRLDQIVYHYCDAETGLKILESGKLWMTHIAYLNDATELKYSVEQILDTNLISQVLTDLHEENRKRVRFRNGAFGITPYIELEFGSTPIVVQEIVLGPRVDEALAMAAFENFRRFRGFEFKIEKSIIPYR